MSFPLEPIAEEQFATARDGFSPSPIPRDLLTQIYTLSIATSLKRIADLFDGTTLGISVSETIFNPSTVQNRDVRNNY
jgi:hypothetical protein